MRTLLLGDIGNRLDIADTEREIARSQHNLERAEMNLSETEAKVERLESELAKQKLTVQALTRFLLKKEIIRHEELDEFIHEVDAEDGLIDGKASFNNDPGRLTFKKKPEQVYHL